MRIHKLCVLGGTGFVGRHLVSRLAAQGLSVRVLTRNRERHKALLVLPTVELVEADVHQPGALMEHFHGCDAVVNLVGILNERGRGAAGFRAVHVDLPRKVVDACFENGVPRLLHMSALGADACSGPSCYLRTKGEGEDLVHTAGVRIHVTSFQPSVIFGPEDSFFNRFASLARLTPFFFPLACPDARFAPVYVGDVAEAFVCALEDKASYGVRYPLCGPHVYSLRELVEYTVRTAGLRRRVVGLPDFVARLQARVLERLPGKLFSMDNYRSLQVDSVCRERNGLQELGITPSPVEAVVPAYLAGRRYRNRYNHYRRLARRI